MFLLSKRSFQLKKSFFNILMVNSKKGRNFGGNFHKTMSPDAKKVSVDTIKLESISFREQIQLKNE